MEYRESCDKREAAARIAAAHPEQLARDPWLNHLRECQECRETATGMAQSLAVFRQVEMERLASRSEGGPSWESLAAALRGERRSRWFLRRYRVPVAAAAVGGLLLFSGAGAWLADLNDGQESPARIVRLLPEQRQRMQQVVQQSLSGTYGGALPATPSQPVPRLAPVEPIASEELAVEPNGLYASGEHSLPGEPVFRQNHPFLEGREMATGNGEPLRPNLPLYPVTTGPSGMSSVSFPVYRPGLR